MNSLIELVENLKKDPISRTISMRMSEFSELGKKSSSEIFKELCFCLLTANFSAVGGIKIQKEINDGFSYFSEEELARKLSELGHRFPNARANFIVLARPHKDNIKEILLEINDELKMREWLVKNIKGLGMKEASHFLRNIGYKNLAILDFHIVDILVNHNIIERPKNKSLSSKKYVEIEEILKKIAIATNTNLGELDLYLLSKGDVKKVLK